MLYEDIKPGDLLLRPIYNSVIIGTPTPDLSQFPEFAHFDYEDLAPGQLIYTRFCQDLAARNGYFSHTSPSLWRPSQFQSRASDPGLSTMLLHFALENIQDPSVLAEPNNDWLEHMDLDQIKADIVSLLK